ncbi:amidohydrolase family protein [Flavobacteriaceae bacterium S0825]|uniref:amidohydrolase family protein n=1 Tax=Gaetbulibacter sp. S0825 TaxID=2720084 RepID=UPI00143186C2|nr:amidohydrolase family protein [Gaetbulibacter sp. S0825]MCK0109131.1 amidohydrolase family protein [Flavobacteriaceae bacterium S0825]NIX64766.1 amidohydrolase family protein [Gaetbulibacter sp. S0825]
MNRIQQLLIALILVSTTLSAQEKKKSWDVSNPEGDWNFKEVSLNTNEGTWMNIDVSPDGTKIAFDLLGDIFIMNANGGKATALRTGLPFEIQPRFSPDGKTISFTSDAGGGDNIWAMNIDGSDAKQITKENFRLLNNAVWTPDGNYLVARKHFSSTRSLGAGEMWMYHLSGKSGIQITKRKNDQQDVNEPSISKDGRYMYYSEDVYPGGFFQYNKDPNSQIYVINRYDFETGKTERITGGPGGAARPQISNDGKKLAFVKRVRTKTVLYIHDLETGEEWPIFDGLNKDQQEAWAIFGVYSNYSWTPNDDSIVFWSGGKINKVNVNTLQVTNIPFEVNTNIKIAKAVEFDTPVAPEEFNAKVIRDVKTSPDGKSIVFNALGYLYTMQLPKGKPKRLTQGTDFEFEPSFSPDGSQIVYVTWNDENLGNIFSVSTNGGTPKKLNSQKGIYRNPSYSNNGSKIVYRKEGGNGDQGRTFSKKTGLYVMNTDGSNNKFLTQQGDYAMFSQDDKRIIFQNGGTFGGALTKQLKSVDLNGNDERTHIKSKNGNRLLPSPDGNWVAFIHLFKVYMAPMPQAGKSIDLTDKSNFVPVTQLTKDAGINLHWSKDSKTIHWTLGNEYYSAPASLDTKMATKPKVTINLEVKTDKPNGRIAFKNARIITMEGDKVIENGTIIVNQNKIEAIGASSEVSIPSNAKVYDVSGKTIMPGIVDAHAHIGGFRDGLTTQKHWQFYANLVFGVTTAHDPSANTQAVFALSELQKNGTLVGPRLYSTGHILYGAEGDFKAVINSLDDARSSIKRTKAFGALSVKSYNQPRREQRQQVLQAAREEGIFVVPEGGSTFYHNMTMIMDGHTGVEHNIPIAPVYKDVMTLWGNSNTGYTPTLVVNYAGMSGEYYWYQNTNVWENEKLLKYMPRSIVDARSRHRVMVPQEEYENGYIATSKVCKALTDVGVKVNLGAHGQLQGLGAHWELWMLQQGGMTNMEALRAATLNGAEYIGAGDDIGSLEVGKLADLVVLDKNPLENIRNSESVIYTMVNGRLYDTETMNEIGNHESKRGKFYWENNKYNAAFPWHEESQSFTRETCGCIIGTH